MQNSPFCPSCRNTDCVSLGAMRPVGGQIVLEDHGQLYDCPRCHMLFRYPYLSEEELIAQYEQLPASKWTADPGTRPDFDHIQQYLTANFSGGSVLDVGCFRGDLLAELPNSWTKLGIEPANEAAEIARGRGVEIVGTSLKEALKAGLSVDMITAVDLAEHLRDPMELVHFAQNALKPGGVLTVATGNADYWLWRRNRLDYWYNWTDHVAFYRRAWFDWAAEQTGLRVVHQSNFAHYVLSPKITAQMAAQSLTYEAAKTLGNVKGIGGVLTSIYPLSRARKWDKAPSGLWGKDHFLVVLKKQ
jgi:SAM-dependent methyltransferase